MDKVSYILQHANKAVILCDEWAKYHHREMHENAHTRHKNESMNESPALDNYTYYIDTHTHAH